MKNTNKITHKQFQINHLSNYQTEIANSWLRNSGINPRNFDTIDSIFIKAQQTAFDLVKHHNNLLTDAQLKKIKLFIQKIQGTSKNKQLKPNFAQSILNMGIKIKRQAHKQQQQARERIQALRTINN
jgi:hypothetical protein